VLSRWRDAPLRSSVTHSYKLRPADDSRKKDLLAPRRAKFVRRDGWKNPTPTVTSAFQPFPAFHTKWEVESMGNDHFTKWLSHTMPHLILAWFPGVQVTSHLKCIRLISVSSGLPYTSIGVRIELTTILGLILYLLNKILPCHWKFSEILTENQRNFALFKEKKSWFRVEFFTDFQWDFTDLLVERWLQNNQWKFTDSG